MLREILDIHLAEIADAHVLGYESLVYILENHHVEEFAAEVETCSRG